MSKFEKKKTFGVATRMAYVAPQMDVHVMESYQPLAGTNNGFGGGAGEGETPNEYVDAKTFDYFNHDFLPSEFRDLWEE